MTYLASNKPITLPELARMKHEGEKIAMLTGYDASFAALEDRCGVDLILVGDSLGNVLQGKTSTLPVTMEHMVYHTECVGHMAQRAMVVSDMPFGAYHESKEQAIRNAGRLLAAGAEMVKLEGGQVMAETVHFLVERGVPVCAHIGLTPQSVHQLGYRRQANDPISQERLRRSARDLQAAGCFALVLECVPAALAARVTASVTIPTIGIGAGAGCDGQVLVFHDLLGLLPGQPPRFVKRYAELGREGIEAVTRFAADVRERRFPTAEHSYGGGAATPATEGDEATGPTYPGGRVAGGEQPA